ncbi:hypothetical protein HUG17_2887 [Dermatophagoides farinae]|uniref:Uncharacterized protein n=1 Tax=Dermatophagoides farinae TaxID=6954 RepID=A0A9D4NV65_DERFA|nr:probable serine/threonine-protein kinase yakA [Dermatophagoides farinae]KAH7638854.1 hypothetical protein HUG17_2887 [Dermatophagoides farinae]
MDETSNDKSRESSSVTKPQQRTGSVQPMAEALRSGSNNNHNNNVVESTNSQRLLQLLRSTEPGQFIPITNREVGEGHVTMIGYTTPIVKVGDPIPIEQYLREQRLIHDRNQQQQPHQQSIQTVSSNVPQLIPASPTSQEEFARILQRLSQNIHNPNYVQNSSPLVTESSLTNSAQESTDIPLRLVFTPNPSVPQQRQQFVDARGTLFTLNDVNGIASGTQSQIQPVTRPEQANTIDATSKLLNIQDGNSIIVDNTANGFQSGIPDFLIRGAAQLDAQLAQHEQQLTASSGSQQQQQQQLSLQLQQHPVEQQQQQQQFVQPLEKPRPFVVMKPGFRNNQKLLHQIQIEHQQQQQPQTNGISSSQSTSESENPFLRFNPLIGGQLVRAPHHHHGVQIQTQSHVNPVPGSSPAFFQHFSAQLPVGQPLFHPIQAVSRVTGGNVGSSQNLGQAHSSFLRSATQSFPPLTPSGGFLSTGSQQQSPSSSTSLIQHSAPQPSTSSFLTGSNTVSQSMPQPFHVAKKQTVQVETVEGPPSSTVDTKAELQNQIKHILASSPNLSEDSRARHREAIFKAVHSLVEPTDSSSSHHHQQPQHQSTDSSSLSSPVPRSPSSNIDSTNRFSGFEPFHPKSTPFNFPVSQTQSLSGAPQRLSSTSRQLGATPSTLAVLGGPSPGSSSSSAQFQQAANVGQIRRPSQIQMEQFTLPPIQPSGKLPLNLLSRYPSLLPGFQPPMLSSQADTGKQDQTNEQKIQTQIQAFLQQHDPQRLQLTQQQQSQQPTLSQEFPGGSFIINQPMFGQPQSQQEHLNSNQRFQQQQNGQHMAKIRLAPGLMLSSDDSTSSSSGQSNSQRQIHTQEGGITITRGKPIPIPPEANRISVATPTDNNENNNLRFHVNSMQASQQQPHHNHQFHNHHPHHNRFQTFQSEASMMTPKLSTREFSEWWKERAVAPSDIASLTMLTQLPA